MLEVILITIVIGFCVAKAVLVVPEGSVAKTFLLGKAHKSYKSGFHIGWFDKTFYKQINLKIGMIATATSENSIEVDGLQIPAKFKEAARVGSSVRIESFDGSDPVVTSCSVEDEKLILCQKCGHANKIRL